MAASSIAIPSKNILLTNNGFFFNFPERLHTRTLYVFSCGTAFLNFLMYNYLGENT